jgi:hypothetical protein
LTEKDGQGPESQQGRYTKESGDPKSCALLRNLEANQKIVIEGGKPFPPFFFFFFLLFHVGKRNKNAPKP